MVPSSLEVESAVCVTDLRRIGWEEAGRSLA